jgi:hypothetical protein
MYEPYMSSWGIEMGSRAKFTKPYLDKLLKKKPTEQLTIWDEKQPGLCVLHSPGPAHRTESTVTWWACYYTKDKPGVPKFVKIGRYGETAHYRDVEGTVITVDCGDIEAVRSRCSEIRNAAKGVGVDPKRPTVGNTIGEIAERYIVSPDVQSQKSLKETLRIFDVYILPEWKDRKADDLQRSDVADLPDKIAAGKLEHKSATKTGKTKKMLIGTPGVAVTVYTQLVSLFGWYGARSDTFKTPIVKTVIGKTWNSKCRDRKLCPEEIRVLSQATEDMPVYGACIRTALLTAQRFFKVAYMRRSDIRNGVWAARRKDDPKKKQVSEVALTPFALSIVNLY